MAWNHGIRIFVIGVAWIALVGCDRTSLQRTFSADPKASQWKATTTPNVQLPADFPEGMRYPNASLKRSSPLVKPASSPAGTVPQGYQTQWSTTDSQSQVLTFYRERLQAPQWQGFKEVSEEGVTVLSAQQQTQQLSVSVAQSSTAESPQPASAPTEIAFTITSQKEPIAASSSLETPPHQNVKEELFADLAQVPLSLHPYVKDVAQLKVLTNPGATPNQAITRAQFARWLVELNNRSYRDRPGRQIRLGTASKPVFVDVPTTHPDFAYIQGLAESGYLPSSLSGDSTQTRFRPGDPLTRETLLLWKVPIDRQQVLPTVSSERVKQLWGFKDTNRITASALSAVAADRQNGDLSNIRRVLGSTLLFQPQKPVTQAEAAAALWFIGVEGDSLSVQDLLRAEQQSEKQNVNAK
jgi:hypothetical protein